MSQPSSIPTRVSNVASLISLHPLRSAARIEGGSPLAHEALAPHSPDAGLFCCSVDVGSEEARLRAGLRPPPKLHVRFPACSFHEDSATPDAREGIKQISRQLVLAIELGRGQPFPAALRQRRYRCDQMRRRIQPSRRWKSFRTWARCILAQPRKMD